MRKLCVTWALIGVLAVLTFPRGVFGQEGPPPGAPVVLSRQQLDQMLAPIALYPDSLLAQILLAATYPDQVIAEDQWLRDHSGPGGAVLNDALDGMEWDLSVKALAPFPQVLDMMAQQREWTLRLGEAFLAQQVDVMDCIQRLRRRAREAGHLKTTVEQRVVVRRDCVEILSVNPEVVYIPRYNPLVVYGAWWWPAYPPFAYYPVWPGVVVAPVVGVYGFWGAVTVGPVWAWGWGSWGWHSHNVFINVNRTVNINTINGVNFRSTFRTTGLHQAVISGRFGVGSTTWSGARATAKRSAGARVGAHAAGAAGRFGAHAGSSFGRSAAGYHTRAAGLHGRGFGSRASTGTVRRQSRGGRYGGAFHVRASRVRGGGNGTAAYRGRSGSFGRNGRGGSVSRGRSVSRGARSFGGSARSFGGGFRRGGGAMTARARAGGVRGGRRR